MPSARPPARRCLGCGKRTRREGGRCAACDKTKTAKRKSGGKRTGSTRSWRKLREQTLRRDGFRCRYPGCSYSEPETVALGGGSKLHADHILPLARGGKDELTNLQALCSTHNQQKGARVPKPQPASFRCSRGCGAVVFRANSRCPACLPTALAVSAGRKPKRSGR